MNYLNKELNKYYNNIACRKGSYLFAEGSSPVCLIAHVDTVFTTDKKHSSDKEFFYDNNKQVLWSPDGLGADDRAGIYAILQLIGERGLRPHIIITDREELGGLGAQQLIKDFPACPFKEVKYLIELDRSGKNDCVFYGCGNNQFISFVEQYGFREEFGSFTDISVIAPAWGIAAVNLSVGYMNEHSFIERLYIKNLESTIAKTSTMILTSLEAPFFKYVPITGGFCCVCGSPITYGSGVSVSFLEGGQPVKDVICDECYALAFEQKHTY